jgi:hypothetical protein
VHRQLGIGDVVGHRRPRRPRAMRLGRKTAAPNRKRTSIRRKTSATSEPTHRGGCTIHQTAATTATVGSSRQASRQAITSQFGTRLVLPHSASPISPERSHIPCLKHATPRVRRVQFRTLSRSTTRRTPTHPRSWLRAGGRVRKRLAWSRNGEAKGDPCAREIRHQEHRPRQSRRECPRARFRRLPGNRLAFSWAKSSPGIVRSRSGHCRLDRAELLPRR